MLNSVEITEDAWQVCLLHCLTTEKEEVMGLLLGDVQNKISKISAVTIFPRMDKRKDRVEVSPEQLARASEQAEQLGLKVIGWYHSHPRIPVRPSAVDIRTQASYQLLHPGWIGLIFSVFHKDPSKSGRVQVTAFQSPNGSNRQQQSNLIQLDDDTEMTESGAESLVKDDAISVPLRVVNTSSYATKNYNQLINLLNTLLEEEKSEYLAAVTPPQGRPSVHPLSLIYSNAVYQKSLCRLFELELLPILDSIEQQTQRAQEKVVELKQQLGRKKQKSEQQLI